MHVLNIHVAKAIEGNFQLVKFHSMHSECDKTPEQKVSVENGKEKNKKWGYRAQMLSKINFTSSGNSNYVFGGVGGGIYYL